MNFLEYLKYKVLFAFEIKEKENLYKQQATKSRKFLLISLFFFDLYFLGLRISELMIRVHANWVLIRLSSISLLLITTLACLLAQKEKFYWLFIVIQLNFLIFSETNSGFDHQKENQYLLGAMNMCFTITLFFIKTNWIICWLMNFGNIIYFHYFSENFENLLYPQYFALILFLLIMLGIMEKNDRNSFSKIYDLNQHLKEFENILKEEVHDPILIFDPKTKEILISNNAFNEKLSESKVHGKDFLSFLNDFYKEDLLSNRLSSIECLTIEQSNSDSNKKYFKQFVKNYVWKNNTNSFLIIYQDVTNEKIHLTTLETTNKFKDLMLASVSHDIRTPLTSSSNYIRFALECEDLNERNKFLNIALDSNKMLLCIVNDLLDFNQFNENKFSLVNEEFYVMDLLERIYSLFKSLIEQKGLAFIIENNLRSNEKIYSDKKRIERILVNLLSNALKFTFMGNIVLKAESKDENNITLKVSDTGIGIKEEDKNKLFTLYGTIKNVDINSEGIGLGLKISNDIVCSINNSINKGIRFKSEYGKGSIFEFDVPKSLEKPDESLSLEFENEGLPIQSTLHRKLRYLRVNTQISSYSDSNILVIEDEISNISVMEKLFWNLGFRVIKSYNGQQAMELIEEIYSRREKVFRLIITDINMPIMNGYKFIEKYREFLKEAEIKINSYVVACTANSTNTNNEKEEKYKFDEMIEKPLCLQKIIAIKEKFLD